MTINMITGYTGTKHITPANDGAFNQGIIGDEPFKAYSLPVFDKCGYTVISDNSFRVKSGVIVVQGRFGIVSQEDLTINSIATNKARIDLVIVRYNHDPITLIDDMELDVVQGTPVNYGQTPTTPSITLDVLDGGAPLAEFKLYRLEISNNAGTVEVKPFKEFVTTPALDEISTSMATVAAMKDYIIEEKTDANGWYIRRWYSGRMEATIYLNNLATGDYGAATSVSGISRRQLNSIPTVPSGFTSLDFCNASGNNSGAWIVGGLNASNLPSIFQQAVSGTNVVARVCIELKGTWQ